MLHLLGAILPIVRFQFRTVFGENQEQAGQFFTDFIFITKGFFTGNGGAICNQFQNFFFPWDGCTQVNVRQRMSGSSDRSHVFLPEYCVLRTIDQTSVKNEIFFIKITGGLGGFLGMQRSGVDKYTISCMKYQMIRSNRQRTRAASYNGNFIFFVPVPADIVGFGIGEVSSARKCCVTVGTIFQKIVLNRDCYSIFHN